MPGLNRIRSAVASARHAEGSRPLARLELGGGLVERGPQRRRARRDVAARRRTAVVNGPATGRARSRRRSFSTYDHQPCRREPPCAGRVVDGTSSSSSTRGRRAPGRARRSRSAPRGVEDGGARTVDLPVEVRVEPAATGRVPRVERAAAAVAPRRRRVPCASTSRTTGHTRMSRRSCVAAPFIAPTTLASVCFFVRWMPRPEQVDALHRAPRPLVVGRRVRRAPACCSS